METVYELLSDHPFLAGMSREHLRRLSLWSHRRVVPDGDRIIREDAAADRFWLIRYGRVALDTQTVTGPVVVEMLEPGDVLGWSWLMPPYRWHFGAVAVGTVLAIELDGRAIRRLGDDDPKLGVELANRFNQVVVERLQATRRRMLEAGVAA